jgi:lysine 6-dehydrogenase
LKTTTFAVLGSGMQGTAAAYDLSQFAPDARILLADAQLSRAEQSAARVNELVGSDRCEPVAVDALHAPSLQAFLQDVDVLLSCVPYWMHPGIADSAIATGTHMCDLGGNTEIALETLGKDPEAKSAGVTLVPDCGLAPGLVNSLGMFLVESIENPESVRLYCGVLPQHPVPPFNYKLTFNIEGLVTEYDYQAVVLRDGEIQLVDTLAELESHEFDGLGTLEAFTTSGGTSTAPYTLQGRLKEYEYKTLRFPGHCERMRIFKDFGFWREDFVDVKGASVRPKDVFNRVFGEALGAIRDQDQCIIRAIGEGESNGSPVRIQLDLHDRQDAATGFTSMERLTGFSLSIIAQEIAAGGLPVGAIRYENAMSGGRFVEALAKRGIVIHSSVS